MFWMSMVDELQRYGPVTLQRTAGRWHATWDVLLKMGNEPIEDGPKAEGQTPAEAVKGLWARYADPGRTLLIGHHARVTTRWNGLWIETPA